jgi:hypothetical protein
MRLATEALTVLARPTARENTSQPDRTPVTISSASRRRQVRGDRARRTVLGPGQPDHPASA